MNIYIYIYICAYIYIYMYVYTHIHTHTYIILYNYIILYYIVLRCVVLCCILSYPIVSYCVLYSLSSVHPIHILRFWSFRTQPLEHITPLPMKKGFWATQSLAKILVREILLCELGVASE